MENQERSDDQQDAQDESVEEFKQEGEEDPSTAQSDDDETARLRGG